MPSVPLPEPSCSTYSCCPSSSGCRSPSANPRPATPFHSDEPGSVVGRPAYEMAYRSIDGQPDVTPRLTSLKEVL